jgi:aspartyl-tRNA(Asn)/glutamyl-tRNA(Gln) amidotransferase subunit A
VIAGHDPKDSTSLPKSIDFDLNNLKKPVENLRIGIPKEYMSEGVSEEVAKRVRETVDKLKEMGAEVKEVSLPHTDYAIPVYYIIAPAEASSNLARFDGIRYGVREEAENLMDIYFKSRGKGFGAEVKRRIMIGTYVLSSGYYDAYYLSAQKVRTLIREDFEKVFTEVDALITPTAPTTAFKLGAKTDDPIQMYLSDIFTISANLAGIPAISVPAGRDSQNLPIGVQIMTPLLNEENLFRVAYQVEGIYR